jgi:hypothetical protein
VGAAVGDHGWLSTLSEEDRKRFTEKDGPLRAVLQVFKPRDRLPAVTQRKGYLLAGRHSTWALVKHHRSS